MSGFAIRHPYFIVVICLVLLLVGGSSIFRMPTDLFPSINLPEAVVATFYNGMPPQDIETDITDPLERFFTLATGVDHMESRSLPGVSIIKVFFEPGTNPDADVTQLSNLSLSDLKRLPPGTLPPVVLKFDASSLPVCLVTLQGKGLTQTQLHDFGEFQIRDQIAGIHGAEIPPPFGGKYRQAMVYVDPYKLYSRQLSIMDVVKAVNDSNLILPAGDVKIGNYDYYVYSNALVDLVKDLNPIPLKTVDQRWVSIGDVGQAEDANQIQYNLVRVNGQRSAYLPIMKAGGNSNTIQVVDGVRQVISKIIGIPKNLKASVVFDQSAYVREAIRTLLHEGVTGLALTSVMILIFLASFRATLAVFLSIPLAGVATFMILYLMGRTINTMILGGLALAFSRIIDNSVISLENIYRHIEEGESPEKAAEAGGNEVSLAVLAATLTTIVVFFPVTFLYGVSRFLFSALALAVAISLFASYFIAMTVIPLFCARFLHAVNREHTEGEPREYTDNEQEQHAGHLPPPEETSLSARFNGLFVRFNQWFNRMFGRLLDFYERNVRRTNKRPVLTTVLLFGAFLASLAIYPLLGVAYFPRTDAGQFTLNLKAPTGTRIEVTEKYVADVENLIRQVVRPKDFRMVVSNIGIVPDFSSLYTTNAGEYTATIQVELQPAHQIGSFEYMTRVQRQIALQYPALRTFFSSGSMVDQILNMGIQAPIDVQVAGNNLSDADRVAHKLADRIQVMPGAGEAYIPQDLDYPAVRLNVDRVHASELGLSLKDVVENVITALNSNLMIAPNFWVDRKTGNDYFLTVQYYENAPSSIHSLIDLKNIPLRAPDLKQPTTLDTVVNLQKIATPTEVDHYQIRREEDIYVSPSGEDLGKLASRIRKLVAGTKLPSGVNIDIHGMVDAMQQSFKSFALGLSMAIVLLYLILVAQFSSFKDPLLIMLAVPMGFIGVMITLPLTHTTLNVMSLMGVLMLVGIAASNSILIVDFTHRLEQQGQDTEDAVVEACRVRLRPILMTSLATMIGLLPMALKMGTGSEQYAPLARAIIGGLATSVLLTVFIVPAAYLIVYPNRRQQHVR